LAGAPFWGFGFLRYFREANQEKKAFQNTLKPVHGTLELRHPWLRTVLENLLLLLRQILAVFTLLSND
jgi:hypothetical protein